MEHELTNEKKFLSRSPGKLEAREGIVMRICRSRLGCASLCRKFTATRMALLFFMAGFLFLLSLQMSQLTVSSAKTVNKKTASMGIIKVTPTPHGDGEAVGPSQPEVVVVKENPKEPVTQRIINNGRSPKQVNEESEGVHDKEGLLVKLNRTVESPEVSENPSLDPLPSLSGPDSLQILQNILIKVNKAQTIYNQDKFPPLDANGLVLVVQVHKREGYLKQLLESLKVARGIEKVLLVISHDYYYDDMNKLIHSIDFCPVMQIFYPFSLQVMPTVFPGASPNDCPRDITKKKAFQMGCTNAQHPDAYGHYREAIVTAIKHHWWWKANMVFDNLRVTRDYDGYVLFLEEDHYVAPDFVHVAHQLIRLKEERCKNCDFINLGMYNKVRTLSNRASVGVWNAGKNNMGFGMNRHTWNLIRNCSEHFCSYDDYNWDWSINQLGSSCPLIRRDLKVVVMRTPRIFHIGTCGTHHHKQCNEAQQAAVSRSLLTRQSANLFPASLGLDAGTYPAATRKRIKAYGGWADVRDHHLCNSFTERGTLLDGKLPT